MKNKKTPEELEAYFNASTFFIKSLQHYLLFQEHYRRMLPEANTPEHPNVVSVSMLNSIADFLAGEPIPYMAILNECLVHSKFSREMTEMVGIFSCETCKEKALVPIRVTSNLDHIQFIKNGQFDLKVHQEYQNTEEVLSMHFDIPEPFAEQCCCPEKSTELTDWLMRQTQLGIRLSDKNVEELWELIEKKKEGKRGERDGN